MIIAVMQPTYLPWLGYFDLMQSVDKFVLLDNVQFEKHSWQSRNRIRTENGLEWLSVPVKTADKLTQNINEVEIAKPEALASHLARIRQNYGRAAYFNDLIYFLESIYSAHAFYGVKLVELNYDFLTLMRDWLGIKTPMVKASHLEVSGRRTDLLLSICQILGADKYLSPPGAAEYLECDRDVLEERGIEIFIQDYEHPVYRQQFEPFIAYASALDFILNHGRQHLPKGKMQTLDKFLEVEDVPRLAD